MAESTARVMAKEERRQSHIGIEQAVSLTTGRRSPPAVAPGAFPTEGASSRLSVPVSNQQRDGRRSIPLKRVGEHIELANLTSYLLSPMAAYISGDTITIDGAAHLKPGAGFGGLMDRPREELKQVMREMRGRTTGKTD